MGTLPKEPSEKPTNTVSATSASQSNTNSQNTPSVSKSQSRMDEKSTSKQPLLNTSTSKNTSLFKRPLTIPLTIFIAICLIAISSFTYSHFYQLDTKVKTTFTQMPQMTQIPQRPPVLEGDIDVDKLTDLSIRLKRSVIQASSLTEQTLPMLASLNVKDLMLSYRAPLDLVCVLDHSGSMAGEKINLLKNTFKYLLHFLNDNDRLSIIMFDDSVSRLVPLMNTTDSNKKKILSAISTVQDRGGTNINIGVQEAVKLLKEREKVNQVTSIFLLSDGLDNVPGAGDRIKDTLLRSGLQDQIVIHTFGFGDDHDPQLMTNIADLTDGSFYFINQLDKIDESFVECLGVLQSSVAESVEITIRPEQSQTLQGVEIVKAYGDATLWTKKGDTYVTKITNLMTGRQKDYVLELMLPKLLKDLKGDSAKVKVASVEAVITVNDMKQIVKKADLFITLLSETTEFKNNEEDDREVMKNYYRVKGALLMDEARKLSDEGKHEEAKKMLENFKEAVENSVLKDEPFIKDMMKDLAKAIEFVNPDTYEKYGRYSLMGNARAQMRQKSHPDSSVLLTNTHISSMMATLEEL